MSNIGHYRAVLGIVPYYPHLQGGRLFDPDPRFINHWAYLREAGIKRGFDVRTIDMASQPDVIVSIDVVLEKPRAPWLYYLQESPAVRPDLYRGFDELHSAAARLFTHSSRLASRGPKARQFSIPQVPPLRAEKLAANRTRKLLVMMNANKRPATIRKELYTKRLRVASTLARHEAIDVYGPGWEKTLRSYNFYPPWTHNVRRRWLGIADSKPETLSGYDFCLAFENAVSDGYITEKLFDPMFVGCIPIYLGPPEIEDILPPGAYVNYREIKTPRRLLSVLQSMSYEEKESRREVMKGFLASASFRERFSIEAWADQMLSESEAVLTIGGAGGKRLP